MSCVRDRLDVTIAPFECGNVWPASSTTISDVPFVTQAPPSTGTEGNIQSLDVVVSFNTGAEPSVHNCNSTRRLPSSSICTTTTSGSPASETKAVHGPTTPGGTSAGATTSAASVSVSSIAKAKSGGLEGGAVAGVAIACLIGGVLLGAALIFLLFGCRKNRTNDREAHGNVRTQNVYTDSKTAATTTLFVPEDSSAAIVENYLPQPVDDGALIGDFGKIDDKISAHLQSFYDFRAPVDSQAVAQAVTSAIGSVPRQLAQLLSNVQTRPAIMRHAVASVIFSRVSLDGHAGQSFLPPGLAECAHSMGEIQVENKVRTAIFSKWKAITSVLLHDGYGQASITESDARVENIRAAVHQADSFLKPFVASHMNDQARSKNLEEIMRRAARFGFQLVSQPSLFRFDWQSPSNGGLVVFPALVQSTDENGKEIRPPRVFVQKSLVKL